MVMMKVLSCCYGNQNLKVLINDKLTDSESYQFDFLSWLSTLNNYLVIRKVISANIF